MPRTEDSSLSLRLALLRVRYAIRARRGGRRERAILQLAATVGACSIGSSRLGLVVAVILAAAPPWREELVEHRRDRPLCVSAFRASLYSPSFLIFESFLFNHCVASVWGCLFSLRLAHLPRACSLLRSRCSLFLFLLSLLARIAHRELTLAL